MKNNDSFVGVLLILLIEIILNAKEMHNASLNDIARKTNKS
jgi:hypothetical protein